MFTQIEIAAQFCYCRLPLTDRCDGRSGQKPIGEQTLPWPRARHRQELKKAARPKEVEVAGVRMFGRSKPQAGAACALPALFNPRKPALIEMRSPLGHAAAT